MITLSKTKLFISNYVTGKSTYTESLELPEVK